MLSPGIFNFTVGILVPNILTKNFHLIKIFSFENPEDYEIKSEPWKRSFLQYRDARHIFPDNENIPTAHTKRKMRPNRIKSIYDIENSENTDIIFLHEGTPIFG